MTGEELAARFRAEGFDYLTTSQALEFINDAYQVDICDAEDWPFLEAETTGSAPLTISDLRSLKYVGNSVSEVPLRPRDTGDLNSLNWNLQEAGDPRYYYITGGTTIKVFPTSTNSLLVRYYKTPAKLTSSTSPLLPERFHSLIVDGAVARAYENSDDYELAQSKEAKFQTRLGRMREALLGPYLDGPTEFIEVTDPYAMS